MGARRTRWPTASKRALACNRNKWKAENPHSAGGMKDGIPNIGFPDCERFTTQFKEAFGDAKLSAGVHPKMYHSVLQDNSHPFVAKFLETATPDHKEQFAGMVRSLEYLRKFKDRERTSVEKQAMDLQENRRLFRPSRQRPVFDPIPPNPVWLPSTHPHPRCAQGPPPDPPRSAGARSPVLSGVIK